MKHYVIKRTGSEPATYLVGADGLVFWTTSRRIAEIQTDAIKALGLEAEWEVEEILEPVVLDLRNLSDPVRVEFRTDFDPQVVDVRTIEEQPRTDAGGPGDNRKGQ